VAVDLAYRANHGGDAARWLDQLTRRGERDPELMTKVVALMAGHGQNHAAVMAADGWRTRHPGDPRGVLLAARARAFAGMPDSAIVQARRAVQAAPDSLEPRVLLGQLYQGRKRYSEAETLLDETVRRFPGEIGITLDLAFCREQLGDIPGAQSAARDALRRDPENATVLNFLGYLLADHDQSLDEALDLIRRALKHDPDNGSFIDSLGWTYYRLGRLGEARKELERAVDLTGGDPIVREHLGDVYKDLRLMDLAKDQYRKSLAGDRSNSRVKTKLAEIR
jgi:tetratricopeptide (TPR) repeat protein